MLSVRSLHHGGHGEYSVMGPAAVFPDANTNSAAVNLAIKKAKRLVKNEPYTKDTVWIEELGTNATDPAI